jgi:hypothetical protein
MTMRNRLFNPSLKAVEYQEPEIFKPQRLLRKPRPEDLLPWRMFARWAPQKCKRCKLDTEVTFIAAKTPEMADKIFDKGNGLSPNCMCWILIQPDHRIATLDGGLPNPAVKIKVKTEVKTEAAPVTPALPVSPFRLFYFQAKAGKECACGRVSKNFYVIAFSPKQADERAERYSMCATCTCEYLLFDRYAIQTTHGGPP